MSYKDDWLRRTAIKSLLTALSLDALGSAYESMSANRRVEWIDGGRVDLPRGMRRTGGYNTDMTMLLLKVFYDKKPECGEPTVEICNHLRLVLRGYLEAVNSTRSTNPYVLLLDGVEDTALSLPIGIAVGYYAVLHEDDDYIHELIGYLVNLLSEVIPLSQHQIEEIKFVGTLSMSLLLNGYFSKDEITMMRQRNAIPVGMASFMQTLERNFTDPAWLIHHFTHVSLPGRMPYAQRVYAESMYYLARVSTNYDLDMLASNPKRQLIDIFAYPYTQLPDVAYTYGAFCTASEHGYSLVPKPLRIAIDNKHSLQRLMSR